MKGALIGILGFLGGIYFAGLHPPPCRPVKPVLALPKDTVVGPPTVCVPGKPCHVLELTP